MMMTNQSLIHTNFYYILAYRNTALEIDLPKPR